MQQSDLSDPVIDPFELRVDGKYNNLDDKKKRLF